MFPRQEAVCRGVAGGGDLGPTNWLHDRLCCCRCISIKPRLKVSTDETSIGAGLHKRPPGWYPATVFVHTSNGSRVTTSLRAVWHGRGGLEGSNVTVMRVSVSGAGASDAEGTITSSLESERLASAASTPFTAAR
ncbi:hypothetical protein PMIN03_009395 [Paraphaeosphaeria minitans]